MPIVGNGFRDEIMAQVRRAVLVQEASWDPAVQDGASRRPVLFKLAKQRQAATCVDRLAGDIGRVI